MLPCLLQEPRKPTSFFGKNSHPPKGRSTSWPYHRVFLLPPDARTQCMKPLTASAVLLPSIPHGTATKFTRPYVRPIISSFANISSITADPINLLHPGVN